MIVTSSEDTMAANMYRVGDYVYFETSSTSPYQIRRIEELNKTPSGNVEAKVMCFFRRRDLPTQLIMLADKHQLNSTTNADDTPISSKLKKMLIKAPEGGGNDSFGGVENDFIVSGDDVSAAAKREAGAADGDCVGGHSDGAFDGTGAGGDEGELTWRQRHQLKHRELFLSRQVETLPATHIRGKCNVTLLNETESYLSYLNKDDTFFYCLVFDPTQKTLLADKGEIRVGVRYQADPTPLLKEDESDGRNLSELETLVWTPSHNLTDRQIDQFLVISRSVGTFARALDCSSSVKQPSLHMSAAAASRDVTLFHAMDTLHEQRYVMSEAISRLVPSTGPVLCRDEMEEWSASEANLFEEALEKYGKDFNDIRHDFLPWKTLKNIIEYYYMWKTTDRYVQQKRVKAVEAESKLKQVYIPNYNKPNPAVISSSNSKGAINGADDSSAGLKTCESCQTNSSSQWYSWGPAHTQYKLCHACWLYWKKYGGLKSPSRAAEETGGIGVGGDAVGGGGVGMGGGADGLTPVALSGSGGRRGSAGVGRGGDGKGQSGMHGVHHMGSAPGGGHLRGPNSTLPQGAGGRPVMKTRAAFYLHVVPLTRVARRLARQLLRPRHLARKPFNLVNQNAVRIECQQQMAMRTAAQLKELLAAASARPLLGSGQGAVGHSGGLGGTGGGAVTHIADRLGDPDVVPDWLLPTDKSLLPKNTVVMFPKPPKAPDGSLLYERVPNKPEAEKAASQHQLLQQQQQQQQLSNHALQASLKRRHYDENGLEGSRSGGDIMLLSSSSSGGNSNKRQCKENAAGPQSAALSLTQLPPTVATTQQRVATPPHAQPHSAHHVNGQGRPKMPPALMTRTGTPRKGVISWMDAPDDVYFRATPASRKMRKQLTSSELRRASRKPWRRISPKYFEPTNT